MKKILTLRPPLRLYRGVVEHHIIYDFHGMFPTSKLVVLKTCYHRI